MSRPLLEIENLVRHYERARKSLFSKKPIVKALDGVSFSVQKGESFGIVGESGSGKSTLARMILALEEPTSGSVRFRGEDLLKLSTDRKLAARRHIQMVFQDPFDSLDPKHQVGSVVGEPLALVDGVSAEQREAKVAEALADVGLEADLVDKFPHQLSGGQRQRIAIARALITRPDLIVADEPVSALDGSMRTQILDLMMELQERFKLTYIIISRDQSVARHATDRLAVMKAGRIVEQGDTGGIFDNPSHAYTRELLECALDAGTDEAASETRKETQADDQTEDALAARSAEKQADDVDASEEAAEPTPAAEGSDAAASEPTPEPAEAAAPPSSAIDAVTAIRAADAAIASAIASARRRETEKMGPSQPPEVVDHDVSKTPNPPLVNVENGDADHTESPVAAPPSPPPATATSGDDDVPSESERRPSIREMPATIHGHHLIDGKRQDASDDRLLKVINPSNGEAFGYIARGTARDVDQAVKAAHRALAGPWGRLPAFERGRLLTRLAQLVEEQVDHLARLEARDVGKPLRQARADALALARYFEFYGGSADKIHGQTIPYHDGYTVMTLREPYGVTGHIVPCNYPMQIIGRSVGAALAMGNASVLKPGEDASLTALEIGQLALDAGFPQGVLNVVTGLGEETGAALAAHPGIDHMSFTGSVATGKRVQQAAATHSCPVTLELGGKSPQIVFADADLDHALPFLVNAAIQNAGQTCSAGSRVLIQDWIYDELTHRLAERFGALDVGPAERDLDCGPVINPIQKGRIEKDLKRAHADRLAILGEGKIAADAPEGGYYVKPTLLGDVPTDHPLAQEEVFGPVLAAIRFSSEEDAVRIANDSAYGLVAGIWTRDGGRQMRLARAIKTGQVFINNYGAGGGVELPFGGVKSSGFGREKGFEALYGFSTLKTVAIRHG